MNRFAGNAKIDAASKCLAQALARAVGWRLSASRAIVRPGLLAAMLIVLTPIFLVLTQSVLHAIPINTITVNTIDDPGSVTQCDLRDAITAANTLAAVNGCAAGTGNDTINFSVSGVIELNGGPLPAISNTSPNSLTIDGTGQTIAIDGSAESYQILYVNLGATLTVNDLTIEDGGSEFGGGIENAGTLTVTNSNFYANGAEVGGGIYNDEGTLTVSNSTFYDNGTDGDGGAIDNDGTATVTNSTFVFNLTYGNGGAIDNDSGTLHVTNCTFFLNGAIFGYGGGIINFGTLTVTNSTLSDNGADEYAEGGGIYNDGTATVTNSILAYSSPGNCGGPATPPVTDGSYNISDDTSCGFTGTGANGYTIGDGVTDTNMGLDPLGLENNGGPTYTIALELGSYAIAAIPNTSTNCPGLDQRGFARPAPTYSACDIGSFEYQPTPVSPITFVGRSALADYNTPLPVVNVYLPAGVKAGDILIAQIVVADGTGTNVPVAPLGWHLIRHDAVSSGGNKLTSWLYYKVATAEPRLYGWYIKSQWVAGVMGAWRGVAASPIDQSSGATAAGPSPISDAAPSLTPAHNNELQVFFYGAQSNVGPSITLPTDITERTNDTSSKEGFALAFGDLAAFGEIPSPIQSATATQDSDPLAMTAQAVLLIP